MAEGFRLLQGGKPARSLRKNVAAELLIDQIVADGLAQDRVADARQQFLPRLRQIDRLHMIEKVRRSDEAELGVLENPRHVGERDLPPVLGEVLVDQVVAAQRRKRLQPFPDRGVGAEIERAGVDHLLRERHRAVDLGHHARGLCGEIGMKLHQVAQRHRRRPSRQAIVAHIDEAADLELAANDLDDDLAVLLRNPGPNAVQPDDVEVGQVGARGELGKRGVEQRRARA